MESRTYSVDEVIAERRQLHRQQVRVRGILSLAFEDCSLRPPGMRKRSRECERKLWVQVPQMKRAKYEEFKRDFEDRLVEILGMLDVDDHGHMSVHPATLKGIVAIKMVTEDSKAPEQPGLGGQKD